MPSLVWPLQFWQWRAIIDAKCASHRGEPPSAVIGVEFWIILPRLLAAAGLFSWWDSFARSRIGGEKYG